MEEHVADVARRAFAQIYLVHQLNQLLHQEVLLIVTHGLVIEITAMCSFCGCP